MVSIKENNRHVAKLCRQSFAEAGMQSAARCFLRCFGFCSFTAPSTACLDLSTPIFPYSGRSEGVPILTSPCMTFSNNNFGRDGLRPFLECGYKEGPSKNWLQEKALSSWIFKVFSGHVAQSN
jgi:hypothetical protein